MKTRAELSECSHCGAVVKAEVNPSRAAGCKTARISVRSTVRSAKVACGNRFVAGEAQDLVNLKEMLHRYWTMISEDPIENATDSWSKLPNVVNKITSTLHID